MAPGSAPDPEPVGYDPREFPPFAVTVDVAVFTLAKHGDEEGHELQIALVKRGEAPFKGCWALPGGFVKPGESLDQAAVRELEEETKIKSGDCLEQVGAFGDPARDPRMRVVTVCYVAAVPRLPEPRGGGDAERAELVPVSRVLSGHVKLAFDHMQILQAALEHVRAALENSPIATSFCQGEFGLSELRAVYEAIWHHEIDLPNFRRKVLAIPGFLEKVEGTRQWKGKGRPGQLYRKGPASSLYPPLRRPEPGRR